LSTGLVHLHAPVPSILSLVKGDVALQVLLPMNRPAPNEGPRFAVGLPDPSGAPDLRTRSKDLHGPLCAVGSLVGERSRETGMVPGGPDRSVSLANLPCQRKSRPRSGFSPDPAQASLGQLAVALAHSFANRHGCLTAPRRIFPRAKCTKAEEGLPGSTGTIERSPLGTRSSGTPPADVRSSQSALPARRPGSGK